jgi:uncharacterized protein (DUF362 family)
MKKNLGNDVQEDILSRRKFLGTLGTAAAGVLLTPSLRSVNLFARGRDGGSSYLAQVAATQATNYDRTLIKQKVQHLFESIGGIGDMFSAGKKVGIKVNLTGGIPSYNAVTHPEVLRAVTELIIANGVNKSDVYVVEALWSQVSGDYTAVLNDLGVAMIDLNKPDPYGNFIEKAVGSNSFYYSSFTMNQILADIDVYVSIAKLKHHYEAGFTGSLKNQVGTVPWNLYITMANPSRRDALHTIDGSVSSNTHLPKSISDLNMARPVHLAVIDGIMNAHGGEGFWNPTFVPTEDHILLAGKDPVATDSIAAHFLGLDPEAQQLKLPALPGEDRGYADNHLSMLHQKGMGTNQLSEIEVVGDGASIVSVPAQQVAVNPDRYQLCQNYPNPFNPSTSIKYYIPQSGHVTIKIHSITGQNIETLFDGSVPAGTHELLWMPKNLASGVYIYEMRAGNFLDAKKLIYQK